MKLKVATSSILLLALLANAGTANPLTQKKACQRFMSAVVRIDVAGGRATGFIVSPDGWIMTAAHVILDPDTGERRKAIAVMLPDGSTAFANVVADGIDYAVLKVEKTKLPSLDLGEQSGASPGEEITIIGYPFSAEDAFTTINAKFCMAGFVTAVDSVTYNGHQVDAIYFQGPAVKGISGGPIISRDTGRVIGIQSQKLAGIGSGLFAIRNRLIPAPGTTSGGVVTKGVNLTDATIDLINLLDRHLANGLGAATGINDAKHDLVKAQKQHGKSK